MSELLEKAPGFASWRRAVLLCAPAGSRSTRFHLFSGRPSAVTEPEDLASSAAVRLFVERARLVRPAMLIDDQAQRDIAEICRRVDGLPLGIELAAARPRLLSPGQILSSLGRRLDTLVGGPADVPDRQRSMRGRSPGTTTC